MQLREKAHHVERFGIGQEGEFNIKVTGKAFKLLSDGLYSDKALAIVRELSCNARDAHVEAGKPDIPFEIHLPNDLEPHFSVKDYGTGLSHDQVMNLYTTYFESTKQDTNEAVGAFGLGSKSPFAYTTDFTVVSRYEGTVTTYTAYISENGVPKVAKMGEQPTDEPNGIEVILAIEAADFSEFAKAAERALARFDPIPEITGNRHVEITPVEYTLEGTGWALRSPGNTHRYGQNNAKAIQGGVVYPIDSYSVIKDEHFHSNRAQAALLDSCMDLFFEIGELDVAVSREHLSYDEETKKAIVKKLNQVDKELPGKLGQLIENCPTYWDACRTFYKLFHFGGPYANLRTYVEQKGKEVATWRGMEIRNNFLIPVPELSDGVIVKRFDRHYSNARAQHARTTHVFRNGITKPGTNQATNPDVNAHPLEVSPRWAYFWDDVGLGSHRRISNWLTEYDTDNVIDVKLFKHATFRDLRRIKEWAPGIPIRRVSELPKPPSNKKQKLSNVKLFHYNHSYAYEARDRWTPTDYDFSDKKGYYVNIRRWIPQDKNGQPLHIRLGRFIKNLKESKLINIDTNKIYGIYPKNQAEADASGNWVNLLDYLEKKLRKELKKSGMLQMSADDEELTALHHNTNRLRVWFEETRWDSLPVDHPFRTLIRHRNEMQKAVKENIHKSTNFILDESLRELRINIADMQPEPTYNLRDEWRALKDKYPMLAVIDDLHGYLDADHYPSIVQYIKQVDQLQKKN